jgi:hypothetical protein
MAIMIVVPTKKRKFLWEDAHRKQIKLVPGLSMYLLRQSVWIRHLRAVLGRRETVVVSKKRNNGPDYLVNGQRVVDRAETIV